MPRKKQYQWKISDEAEGVDSLPPSRSEKKRQSLALQNMGEELTRLGPQEVKNLDLPADLREALQLYARIGDHEGRRRQMQYVGKLMRRLDDAEIESIHAALQQQRSDDRRRLARDIREAITHFEPRLLLGEVQVNPLPEHPQRLSIRLLGELRSKQAREARRKAAQQMENTL